MSSGGQAATAPRAVTLGILAGGRASRLGGRDKAWLQRAGVPQVVRWQRRFAALVNEVLVSSNTDPAPYAAHGLRVVADRAPEGGPLAGLDALAHACTTPWLLTLPVDLVGVNECLLQSLQAGAAGNGAFAHDDDGPQPLVALWRTQALRDAATPALEAGQWAVHRLQADLGMACVGLVGVRFGNLNTPDDLRAAGIDSP